MSRLTLLFACATIAVTPLGAQSLKVKEEKAGMLKQAKVAAEAALATAQAKVPGGSLKSAEIEKEDGKLSYAFSFTTKGKSGEDEVLVDAMTGAVLSVEHETPASEAKEKAEDAAKAKAAKGAAPTGKKPPV